MRIIIEIRERKKKPKLRDFIALYRSKKDQPGAKVEFQKKFRLLYSIDNKQEEDAEDEKFDKLMGNFDRIQRQLTQQQQAISHIVKRVNNLTERREGKEERFRKRQEDKMNGISSTKGKSKVQKITKAAKKAP